MHLAAAARESVIADLVIDAGHRQIGFRLPIERQIEIAGEDLPPRSVFELHDVALGMRLDLHRSPDRDPSLFVNGAKTGPTAG